MGTKLFFLGILFVAAIFDLKKKNIPFVMITIMILPVIINFWGSDSKAILIAGGGLGLLFLLAGFLFNKHIGLGDGWIIMLIGLMFGLIICIKSVFMAALLTLLVGFFQRIRGRKCIELPFIPFLFLGITYVLAFE